MVEQLHLLSEVICDDMVARFLADDHWHVEWTVFPAALAEQAVAAPAQVNTFSLIQAKRRQDSYDKNFSNGSAIFNSETSRSLTFTSQLIVRSGAGVHVTTVLSDPDGDRYTQELVWQADGHRLKTWTTFTNRTAAVQTLDALASVCLAGLSPFHQRQRIGNLDLIRLRSKWAMEGRLEQRPIEEYGLEQSWKPSGLGLESFGQNGTMPVRRFFPLVGVQDRDLDCLWLVQLAGKASWRLNAARLDDRLILFGGLPDRDTGDWFRDVAPGETIHTPFAYITCGLGTLLKVAKRLHEVVNATDASVIYNEWATTWGEPTTASIKRALPLLAAHRVGTYVIDAGWFRKGTANFDSQIGDWQVSRDAFPDGLTPVVAAIHDHGMKAGIWFEFENVGPKSNRVKDETVLAKRDGQVVATLKRRFLDMTLPANHTFLQTRMIDFLKDGGFDYLKVDYNDTLGPAIDGQHPGAAALEDQVDATLTLLDDVHHQLPTLEIENCSSGGHRLTPAFIEATEFSSFSDAHDTLAIPIVAANELVVIPPAQNLIWCVLHADESLETLYYHLIATFQGRICLSGDIRDLSAAQWVAVDAGIAFYQAHAALIFNGTAYRLGAPVLSYHEPHGVQVVGFYDGSSLVDSTEVVAMVWSMAPAERVAVDLGLSVADWEITDVYGSEYLFADSTNLKLMTDPSGYHAVAVALKRKH